jgi:hypothetical protein
LSSSTDFGEYLGFDTKGGYKDTQSGGGGYSTNPEGTYYDTLNRDNKKLSDISYLGDWKKTSDKTPYFDKFKGEIDMSANSEPARKNPINTPPPKINKIPKKPANKTPKLNKTELSNIYLKNGIDKLIETKQEKNWQSVSSLVISLYQFNNKYFRNISTHPYFNYFSEAERKRIIDKKILINYLKEMEGHLKEAASKLTSSYDGTYRSVDKILNDIFFYTYTINILKKYK